MAELTSITPYLVVSNAAAAIEYYKTALGAVELNRHKAPHDDRIMHAHLQIGGADLMLSDDFSEHMKMPHETPEALGGSPVTLALTVPDAHALWAAATAAGAVVTMELKEQFWGDLYGQFRDPFGHKWSVSQTVKQVDPAEFAEKAAAAFDA